MMQDPDHLIWLPTGGHIGDAVMITALFSEILEKRPELRITYLVRRNAQVISEITRAYPSITVIPIPYAPFAALKVVAPLLRHKAIGIAPPAWYTHPPIIKVLALLFKLRGNRVIGFKDRGTWQPYTTSLPYDFHKRYIDNLRAMSSLIPVEVHPEGSPPRMKFVSSLSKDFPFKPQSYIAIHPFPHMSTHKTMPVRRWQNLLAKLENTYPQYNLVITGAEVDRGVANEITRDHPQVFSAINASMPEVAGIIQNAKLYIGIDTGPTHIAGVLSVPSVIIAQQNEPVWLPTYNPNAALVWEPKNCVCGIPGKTCEVWEDGNVYRRCVYDVSDKAISDAIEAQLK